MRRTVEILRDGQVVRAYAMKVVRVFGGTTDADFVTLAQEEAGYDKALRGARLEFRVRETRPGDEEI